MSRVNAARKIGCLGCAGGEFRLCSKLKIDYLAGITVRTCQVTTEANPPTLRLSIKSQYKRNRLFPDSVASKEIFFRAINHPRQYCCITQIEQFAGFSVISTA
jgi:hypothetical protein